MSNTILTRLVNQINQSIVKGCPPAFKINRVG